MRHFKRFISLTIQNVWIKRFAFTVLTGLLIGFIVITVTQCQNFEQRKGIVINLLSEADRYAVNGMYQEAVDMYNELLRQVSDTRQPETYGAIKNNLGVCYYNLYLKDNQESDLQKSIIAYTDALIIRTIDD